MKSLVRSEGRTLVEGFKAQARDVLLESNPELVDG